MEKSVAIITARGGSKRIHKKNIRDFCGKPIIAYSIDAAIKSGLFDEVMVSTDDEEIACIALSYGAKVPFYRSKETAGDYSTTADVIKEVLLEYKKRGHAFDFYCCIYPTAPFLTAEILKTSKEKMMEAEADFLTPVARLPYPAQRCFVMKDGKLSKKWPEYQNVRTQDLEPLYYDCGQFYMGKADKIFTVPYEERKMTGIVIPDERVQDIDTPEDWKMAEEKYMMMKDRI